MALSKKEKSNQDFIQSAFRIHKGRWVKTAERLLKAFHGTWYRDKARRHRFAVNEVYSLVNLILPNFIFQQPYINVTPLNPRYMRPQSSDTVEQKDGEKMARNMTAVINHHYDKIGAIFEDRKAIQDCLFYGIGITKDGYSFETISKDDEDYVLKDTGFHKRVNPRDFGWHPLATGPDDSIKLVHRTVMTREQAKARGFKKVNDWEGGIPQYMRDKVDKSTPEAKKIDSAYDDFVTVYEVHDQESDMVYVFGGENHILEEKNKKQYHFNGSDFNIIRFAQDNDEFLGISMLAMVEDQMVALNEVTTLMVEHFRKFPGQVFMSKETADIDQIEKIRSGEQGSIHVVNDVNGIIRTNPLQMGQDYYQITNLMFRIIDRVLGIPDFQRLSGSSRKSATEASFIQGDATVRRNYFLGIVKDFVLEGVKKQASLKQQFQDEKEIIQSTGELNFETFEVSKEDIQGEFMFNFDVDNMTAVNEAQFNNINNLLTIMSNNPFLQPTLSQLDPFKAGKKLFELVKIPYDELTNDGIEEVVHVSPEKENEIAAKGELMPRPKKGENFDAHIEKHREFLLETIQRLGGPERAQADPVVNQVLEHIAETEMLSQPQQAQQQPMQGQPAEGPRGPMRPIPQQ